MKKQIKPIILISIGIILGITLPVAASITKTLITSAENITLSSNKTSATDVKEALDDLYDKAGKCPEGLMCTKAYSVTLTKAEGNTRVSAEIGDTIGITVNGKTENFYVISNVNHKVSALAYYNLNVGDNQYKENGVVVNAGIQDEHVLGEKDGFTTYGNVKLSNSNGWSTGSNNLEKNYAGPVNTALYGSTGYEKYIQQTIPEARVRLIQKSELEALGCSFSSPYCKTETITNNHLEWIYSTTYWTGSAYSADSVWRVISSVGFSYSRFAYPGSYGVRPVIEFTEF